MKLTFVFLIILTSFVLPAIGQDIEEDNMVLYIKANLLYDSGRYDEAVRMYNRILSKDDNYTNAYIMRAKTKYALGAYKGTKQDVLIYIERAGVNKELIRLMAETEFKLNNLLAADNYAKIALEMDAYDGDLYYLSGMIAAQDNRKNDACESFSMGSSLGHGRCSDMFNSSCYGYVIRSKGSSSSSPAGEVASALDSVAVGTELSSESGDMPESNIPEIASQEEPPVDLTAVQEIKIDDKLNLVLTNGLGERYVEFKPNILIISSEDGHVAIDLCVNSDGKVISADFNKDRSTINRSSLTSLALRKTKEFIFIPSLRSEQCGTILYKVRI